MEESSVVNREEFETQLKAKYEGKPGSNRSVWNRETLENVKKILSEPENKTKKKTYHWFRNYDLLKIGESTSVILKRSNESEPIVYMVATEDYYDKLLEAHVQTGHGGRDKILYYLKEKFRIPKVASEIFVKCCQTCNRKRAAPKKGVVIKPIVTEGFNSRVQIDLIDFQTSADGEYKWILHVQDHATKFSYLRPLKSKHAAGVAEELFKIFFTVGGPAILQSDNGSEFIAAVIHALLSLWPGCKMIHGRARHPQTQGSVERANQDVENMLRAWIEDNKDEKGYANWSRGCYVVQV